MALLKGALLLVSVVIAVSLAERHGNVLLNDILSTADVDSDEGFRLPRDTVPIHYTIRLRTAVHEGDRDFLGSVDIHLDVVQPTDNITVHNRDLEITSAVLFSVNGEDWTEIDRPSSTYDEHTEHLTFQCASGLLQVGNNYALRITYNGRLQTEMSSGFFRKYYRDENNIRRYIAATQFEPTRARMAFPCYDEPSLKATFTVSLIHHSSYNAVSNMPREDPLVVDTLDPDFLVSTFAESPRMSTYLVAFAVTDFETRTWIHQEIHARPNAINDTEFALSASDKILYEFNKHLDISYWNYMPKLAQIAIPDRGSAAMENWGLVTYGESVLLFDPDVNTYRTKADITTTIAHENAHQWFGNLVTNDWWKYLWLNEGFATLYGYYGAHLAYAEEQYMDLFQLQVEQLALIYDASETTRPMNWNAETPAGISSLFDTVAYQKSASVINMLRIIHGEENFRDGLKKYLLNRELSTATPDDLYEALQETYSTWRPLPIDMTVKQFMETWTNAPGYPVVNVRRVYGGTQDAFISQERFLADKKLPESHVWYIPYNGQYISFLNITVFSWLTEKATKRFLMIGDDEPLILNRNLNFGFYRINYDTRNWELITAAWIQSPDNIDPNNRAQLIDDAFALARADLLDFSIVLRLLTGLKNDFYYLPWASADKVLTYLHDRFRGTSEWHLFEFYAITLIDNSYRNIQQFDVIDPNETLKQKHFREQILSWACRLKDFGCSEKTEQMFKTAVSSNSGVHPDISSVVYCYGVRYAMDEEFIWLYERMFNSHNEAERALLIKALGCSQNKAHLDAYLTTSIGSGVGTEVNYFDRERLQVLTAVYSASRVGVDALIDFLNNWDMADDFIYWLEQPAFDNAIANIAARTNTEVELDRLKELFQTVGSLAPESVVNTAMATVKANLDWHDSLESFIIIDFFERYINEASPSNNHEM
ncbi:aminopeptidase N-like [Ochlerotatus camptorhynchus]|uniref:aminopeptidase N-like n=1 Tax=Ochlerotatus camptorhynchus TaxID=644619 RepID=UPI0031DF1A87